MADLTEHNEVLMEALRRAFEDTPFGATKPTEPAEQMLTADEREAFFLGMSEGDFTRFASHVLTHHPLVFDEAAAYLGRRRAFMAAQAAAAETDGAA